MIMQIMKRREAKTQGLSKYFTNKPCSKGHVSERYTFGGNCCECVGTRTKTKVKAEYFRNYRKLRRDKIIAYLGGKCVKCGFSDVRALQIDHINGGGSKERKVLKMNEGLFYKKVREDATGKYQLLCANCNWIKKHENSEVC